MINQAAQQYGIDPIALAATLQKDSGMGTNRFGKSAGKPQDNNPGNVGQTDSKSAAHQTVGFPTMQDGINAAAKNLAQRYGA